MKELKKIEERVDGIYREIDDLQRELGKEFQERASVLVKHFDFLMHDAYKKIDQAHLEYLINFFKKVEANSQSIGRGLTYLSIEDVEILISYEEYLEMERISIIYELMEMIEKKMRTNLD